jgi:hypothetical protein
MKKQGRSPQQTNEKSMLCPRRGTQMMRPGKTDPVRGGSGHTIEWIAE